MSRLAHKLRLGTRVFGTLAALTVVEWFAARWPGSLLWLGLIALAKTALIAEYFMHYSQLVRGEE
ncbi:MAG: cytochrome C oxidase subunit IV family protein [Armatimonadota bacterium]|nr:cytochrome C oxidase subunit IV family protein [Armatimonadota bacterium]MDR7440422.1 cytochrome C oxidase subunit IV family protein [Armatimonadota bacterium]MDR7444960.1 cytochrome C oxidase subunit IV family protein [Armatimonadota bacterium]MDR7570545.1 cytochrome C oxidase subunit IV family protein [Armatimonadota bacterium]MDR7615105.1 cytochrome C oxidase subunit IV family protein [Armatimonadota bacterium]